MPIRDDSAGEYGTWNNNDLSWIDWLKANASDGGNALSNLGRNLAQGFSPIGTSEQGNMALQVPPMAQGLADSAFRLFGTPNAPGNMYGLTGVPEFDKPIQDDMTNLQLALYGGNAVAGLPKPRGALGAGAFGDKPPILDRMPAEFADDIPPVDRFPARGVARMDELLAVLYPKIMNAPGTQVMRKGEMVKVPPLNDLANAAEALSPYDVSALNQAWRDKTRQTGELFSDTGKPSILGSAMAGENRSFGSSADLSSSAASAITQPLAMDHASRMARASELGFDIDMPLYHGTQAKFDAFRPSADGSSGPGVYVTRDKRHAQHFTSNKGRSKGEVLNLYARGPMATWDDIPRDVLDRSFWTEFLGRDGTPATRAAAWAKDNGFRGFSIGDDSVIFDPANIRSVNAAFDPARAGENGLLLSDNRPSLLGSALATGGENYDLPEWLRF